MTGHETHENGRTKGKDRKIRGRKMTDGSSAMIAPPSFICVHLCPSVAQSFLSVLFIRALSSDDRACLSQLNLVSSFCPQFFCLILPCLCAFAPLRDRFVMFLIFCLACPVNQAIPNERHDT